MTTLALPSGSGKVIGSGAGAVGGRILGGIIGSVFGPAGTVVGQYAGGIAGRYLGGMAGAALEGYLASNAEEANDKADEGAKAETKAKADDETCSDCQPRCRELEQQMNDEMYANKRGPGGQGKHGLANRRAEQICGQYGPGMTKMESVVRGSSRVIRESRPWDTHNAEIKTMQNRLRNMKLEYEKLGCKKNPDRKINDGELERMVDNRFNPAPSEWLGPDHPSCEGLGTLMRENVSPELPKFPLPGRGNGNPGVPTS